MSQPVSAFPTTVPANTMSDSTLEALGQEFQQLRQQPGHFQTQRGDFNAAVDGFSGRKHQVMKVYPHFMPILADIGLFRNSRMH